MKLFFFKKTSTEVQINRILKEFREKTLAYLSSNFSMSIDDCQDVFQESSIILYQQAVEGKLDNIKSSLYTYFVGICKNKAYENIRKNSKIVNLSFDIGTKEEDLNMIRVNNILTIIEDNEVRRKEKQNQVQKVVADLPSPCYELLWGFYRDSLSIKELTKMFNYSNENTLKVTKHRCCEKFRKRYNELKSNF